MKFQLKRRQFFSLLLILGLVFALFAGLILVSKSQEIRKKAAGTSVTLALYPTNETFILGASAKVFELKAIFTGGTTQEKLDYFITEINFSKVYLEMPVGYYINTSQSGFTRIFRVDGPTQANSNGKIVIELGAENPGTGPATGQTSGQPVVLTIAKIYFVGKAVTPSSQNITISSDTLKTQIVNNLSQKLPFTVRGASYTVVSGGVTVTPTLIPMPTSTRTPTPTRIPILTPTRTPTPTCSPRPPCLNLEIPCTLATPPGGWCPVLTPTPTKTPIITLTPTPTLAVVTMPVITITPPSCPRKSEGDANCDSKIDGVDYSIWLNSQCHPGAGQKCADIRADFNGDRNVDNADYWIWFNHRI